MVNLCRLHLRYLFSKVNLIIICCLLIIMGIGLMMSIDIFGDRITKWQNHLYTNINYQASFLVIIKMTSVLISSFLIGNSFIYQHDQYAILTNQFRKTRIPFLLTKLIVLISFITIFIVCLFILYALIGLIFNNYFKLSNIDFYILLSVILISYSYGFLSCILVLIFPSILVILVAFVLFIIGEILGPTQNDIGLIYQFIFPTIFIENNQVTLTSDYLGIICIIFIELMIIIMIYRKKEF